MEVNLRERAGGRERVTWECLCACRCVRAGSVIATSGDILQAVAERGLLRVLISLELGFEIRFRI